MYNTEPLSRRSGSGRVRRVWPERMRVTLKGERSDFEGERRGGTLKGRRVTLKERGETLKGRGETGLCQFSYFAHAFLG